MILGITGGTGSGKSTLLSVVSQLGGTVIDCDRVYHELLQTSPSLLAAIEDRFPGTVAGGALQRKKLGAIVFSDPEKLKALNRITHSAIRAEVLRRMENACGLIAIDAIALHESGLAELCDTTVAITAPLSHRIARLMARDGIPEDYAASRIAAQKSDDWFCRQCNHVLENDSTEAEFRNKCLAFLRRFGYNDPNIPPQN